MLNVSLLVRSGVRLQSALEMLYERATGAWLRVRIHAVLENIALGASFGDALRDTGYNFPATEAISYLRLLSRLQGFDQAMAKFAQLWLEETVVQVKAAAGVFTTVALLAVGGTMGLVVMGMSGIQSVIAQSA